MDKPIAVLSNSHLLYNQFLKEHNEPLNTQIYQWVNKARQAVFGEYKEFICLNDACEIPDPDFTIILEEFDKKGVKRQGAR